jgi:hypothetical protein
VHAADVDGDGRLDLLSACKLDKRIAWYKNSGGLPEAWIAYTITTTADGANSVYAADVDGDGLVDVLSASYNDDKIAWYKNSGGSPVVWTPYVITTAANGAEIVHAADVDHDGLLDVLSASSIDGKIAWYRNGGGRPIVWASFTIATADRAYSVFAADVDGDGWLDVLSASGGDDRIVWYKNGGGNPVVWTPYTITSGADSARSVFAVDVDSDGRIDVLSASFNDDKIAWYKNSGGSPVGWTQYIIATTANGAQSIYAVDVDGDGWLDVLSASGNDNKIAWYRNGGGSPVAWTPYVITTSAVGAEAVYGADVNGDGQLDVLSASYGDNRIAWYLNMMCPRGSTGPGGYAPCTPCPPGRFSNTSLLEVCEFCPAGRFGSGGSTNNSCSGSCTAGHACPAGSENGTAAACFAGTYSLPGAGTCLACPSGKYSGAEASACSDPLVSYNITSSARSAISVLAADLDGDGRLDVLSASEADNKVAWYKNGGNSPVTWTSYSISTSALGAHSVHVADLDSDGWLDVLSASHGDDTIRWYKNSGGTTLVWTEYSIASNANRGNSVFAADLDGDGRLDALSASGDDNKIAWYRNGGGDPVSWAPYVISSTAYRAWSVYAADIDGDGRVDVLSASGSDDKIAWYRNDGGMPVTWTPNTIIATADLAASVFAADVDGDGRLDVLSASYNDDKIAWYKNGGGSPVVWTPYVITTAADGARSVFAVDMDGDGLLDVLSASGLDNKVAWYKNVGGSPVVWTPHIISSTAVGARAVSAADLDGDGRLDVLSASMVDNRIAWYMNMMCPRGSFGPGGYAPCNSCPPGRFSSISLLEVCEACTAGRFGSGGSTNASCSGPCTAGFACPTGSPNATAAVCSAGFMCPPGSPNDTASVCPAGQYSVSGAASCTSCPAGRFGSGGSTNASCSGPCTAGYACPVGSGSATEVVCPAGLYAPSGASNCTACPAGRYGLGGSTNVSCSGPCSAGYACPVGSLSATAAVCPAGLYAPSGASNCTACPAGRYGLGGSTNASCSGPCSAGYACPVGSVSATAAVCLAGLYAPSGASNCTACPAGRYGLGGSTNASCSGLCTAGTYSPVGAGVCILCPSAAPFSAANSASAAACSTCVLGCDGTYGRYPCVDATWSLWYDTGGVETANRCARVC